jgi:hypothetical protein
VADKSNRRKINQWPVIYPLCPIFLGLPLPMTDFGKIQLNSHLLLFCKSKKVTKKLFDGENPAEVRGRQRSVFFVDFT